MRPLSSFFSSRRALDLADMALKVLRVVSKLPFMVLSCSFYREGERVELESPELREWGNNNYLLLQLILNDSEPSLALVRLLRKPRAAAIRTFHLNYRWWATVSVSKPGENK